MIDLILEENGRQFVHYFVDEEAADADKADDATVRALGVIGSWSDLDCDETAETLHRIRHESTPPIAP